MCTHNFSIATDCFFITRFIKIRLLHKYQWLNWHQHLYHPNWLNMYSIEKETSEIQVRIWKTKKKAKKVNQIRVWIDVYRREREMEKSRKEENNKRERKRKKEKERERERERERLGGCCSDFLAKFHLLFLPKFPRVRGRPFWSSTQSKFLQKLPYLSVII